jgi:hypothetical protein
MSAPQQATKWLLRHLIGRGSEEARQVKANIEKYSLKS